MEIDLLQHSTYNVEQIKKNKEFASMLFNKIQNTYRLFSIKDSTSNNVRNISVAPSASRIQNVFITFKTDGEIEFLFRGRANKLKELKDNYLFSEYSMDSTLIIKGVNSINYSSHLPAIVKALEYCDYSFV
jgi:hypothetical protein